LAGEKNPSAIIKYRIKMTGVVRWSTVKATAIYGSTGKPELAVNVMNDLTERKELENKKDDFISMASHELKTPLTSMNIYFQVLKKHLETINDEKGLGLQKKISKQLVSLTDLVKEMLDVASIEKTKLQLKKEKFLIEELAEEIVESLQYLSNHELQLDWSTKHHVVADKERIRQVLINLVSNAIKYSSQHTKIIIRSKKKDEMIIVSVEDSGIGIAEKDRSKLFGRFYQAGEGEKTYPGLGLGLYISSQIVAMHGGEIWVDSEIGKGSTFYFSLPTLQ
jgi:signal transduction histidine kinase